MLSTMKTNNNLNRKNPNEVITDDAAALIISTIITFNGIQSTHDYLKLCLEMLFENKTAPPTYIRIDRSHVVKLIMKNTNLNRLF